MKDLKSFEEELAIYCPLPSGPYPGYHIVTDKIGDVEVHAVIFITTEGFPFSYQASKEDIFDVQMIWWESFFSRHLEDDWIAVVFETQKQGLEFLAGNAYAYNNQMQSVTWSLDWVLPQMVKTLGSKVTHVAKKPIFLPPVNPENLEDE